MGGIRETPRPHAELRLRPSPERPSNAPPNRAPEHATAMRACTGPNGSSSGTDIPAESGVCRDGPANPSRPARALRPGAFGASLRGVLRMEPLKSACSGVEIVAYWRSSADAGRRHIGLAVARSRACSPSRWSFQCTAPGAVSCCGIERTDEVAEHGSRSMGAPCPVCPPVFGPTGPGCRSALARQERPQGRPQGCCAAPEKAAFLDRPSIASTPAATRRRTLRPMMRRIRRRPSGKREAA
jgi:hypothetical protein